MLTKNNADVDVQIKMRLFENINLTGEINTKDDMKR